ncbi:MAG TPA: VWA domain-containing protein [Terriglobia bacterium]|nr:VWA domain-containing protein [Terriglobia bacterium]
MRKAVFALCAALTLGSAALAQLRVDVALVEIVATVTDDRGRYVSGLTADDFILEEDGVPQAIAHVTPSNNLPVSLGILLDVSSSMRRKMDTATAAIERFIRTIHEDDDIFLMTFADRSAILQEFTNDRNKLGAAMRRIQLGPNTALYDAVDDGLLHIQRAIYKKRAILLVTDGEESGASADTYNEALANVREDEVMLYCLGIAPSSTVDDFPRPSLRGPSLGPAPRGGPRGGFGSGFLPQAQRRGAGSLDTVNMEVLRAFADASGGQAWLVRDEGRDMDRIMDIIANELRNQYNIDYYPSRPLKDGKWHQVEIRMKNPRHTVRARKDYFGG